MKEKLCATLKKWLLFFLNPRLLLCLLLGWMLTNGWSYLFAAFGSGWVRAVGLAWLAFLWFPFTPEKIVTVALAILFLRLLFPHDEKTLAVLREEYARARRAIGRRKKGGGDTPSAEDTEDRTP